MNATGGTGWNWCNAFADFSTKKKKKWQLSSQTKYCSRGLMPLRRQRQKHSTELREPISDLSCFFFIVIILPTKIITAQTDVCVSVHVSPTGPTLTHINAIHKQAYGYCTRRETCIVIGNKNIHHKLRSIKV